MTTVWRLARLLARARRDTDRLSSLLSVLAFAVATGSLLVTVGGVQAFLRRGSTEHTAGAVYAMLATVAATLLVVPILTLGGVAARLALARRDRRLAALRLAGATSRQVAALTLVEAAAQAVVGALAGVVIYTAALVPVGALRFDGRALGAGSLWLGPWVGVVALGIVALALGAAVSTLARVVVTPLGVASRHTPRAQSAMRLALAVGVSLVWVLGFQLLGRLGEAVLVLAMACVVEMVNVVGPWLVQQAARATARRTRSPITLLSARRIQDDPQSTWRSVGALSLGVLVAACAGAMASSMIAQPDPSMPHLGQDLITGSAVALVILSLVAATSSGVMHATRVYDQRETLRAQVLAGTTVAELRAVRRREVTLPLAVGVAGASVQGLMLLAPAASQALNLGGLLLWVAAIIGSFVVALLALRASDGLVARAVELR